MSPMQRSQQGRSNRRKGRKRELDLIARCLAAGIHAKRESRDGSASKDVLIHPAGTDKLQAEVKSRKNGDGFKTLEGWKGDNDLLVLWRDRAEPLVVMDMALALKLMGGSDA